MTYEKRPTVNGPPSKDPLVAWKSKPTRRKVIVNGPPSSGKNRTEEEDRTSERLKKCGGLKCHLVSRIWKFGK